MAGRLGLDTPSSLAAHRDQHGPLPTLPKRHGGSPGGLVDEVERAGLRGRGGGWFPTHLKLRAVVKSSHERGRLSRTRQPVVIGNAMEGEPASSKDEVLLAASPHLVLDGIQAAAQTVGATDAFLAVHRGSPSIGVLERALYERAAARVDDVPITLVTPPARYVSSEESALSHWVGDGIGTPVYPDRPFQRGAAGRPTLVQNAETLAHMALIARHGGSWYSTVGAASAPGTTLVTVGGGVARPGIVEVPTGTSVADILALCGGPTGPIRGYLTGGYGGGWVAGSGFDAVAWDPDSVRNAGGVIGASILWAVDETTCPLEEMARVAAWMAGESAGQCGPCMFGLPTVADDVRALALRQFDEPGMKQLRTRLGLITGRGGCKHPDGTARFVSTGLAAFDDEVALHLDGRCSVVGRRPVTDAHALPVPPVRLTAMDPDGRDFE
ncbi:MAG: proton-conducting membrane transporter [Actinomycetales bacterium]|nr:proton-conducting membrane transporter [Actinomycetales bacterium]